MQQQRRFEVRYDGIVVDTLVPDLIVDDIVIADPKVVSEFNDTHIAQMIGYLAITELQAGAFYSTSSTKTCAGSVWCADENKSSIRDIREIRGSRITQQQLESYLWGAAVLLRGTIDAGDYKQFIFPLLFYKRLCDVFDEETQTALAESGGDSDVRRLPGEPSLPGSGRRPLARSAAGRPRTSGQALQSAMRAIETANPDKLYGIFGDAQWTNKDRLSDAMLRDLIEHFSTLELTVANLPEDELGQGYEYLIKKFADDSGHTAAEFYTNRTVVHLMTEMLEPQPGESIYDPTCGSGGMLLSCIAHLRRQGKEWRNVKPLRPGAEPHDLLHRPDELLPPRHRGFPHRARRHPGRAEVRARATASCASTWCWPIRPIPSSSGTATPSPPTPGAATSTAPRRRAAPTTPSGSTSCEASRPRPAAAPSSSRTACSSGRRRRRCGASSSKPTSSSASSASGRTSSTTRRWKPASSSAARPSPRPARGKILFINAVNEVTRERAQSFLTDDHIERIVRAYQRVQGRTRLHPRG